MKIFLLIILTSAVGYCQSKIEKKTVVSEAYVKIILPTAEVSCELMQVSLYASNKRLIFKSNEISFDLKVTKRTEALWYAKDSGGVEYRIRAAFVDGEPVLGFLPDKSSGLRGVIVSRYNLCK